MLLFMTCDVNDGVLLFSVLSREQGGCLSASLFLSVSLLVHSNYTGW